MTESALKRKWDLKERSFKFAMRDLGIAEALPETAFTRIVREQVARSALSVGANVEEADGTRTPLDARKSLVTARKELRETRYWLRVVQEKWRDAPDVRESVQEATELLKILSSIIEKLGNRDDG